MDWLEPDESGIGWTRDGVPYLAYEPALSPAPAASYRLPPLTFAPGALDIFASPASVARADYQGEDLAAPPLIRISASLPFTGVPRMEETSWWDWATQPAPADWANVIGGDPIGGKAWPSSDPLGVYDALRYGPAGRMASRNVVPASPLALNPVTPRFNIPTPLAAGGLSSWLLIALAAGAALILLRR